MAANAPLPEPEETFAKMVASGMAPQLAYSESRIGAAKACTVDQAQRLPGMWARVQWLKENQAKIEPEKPQPEHLIDPKNVSPIDVMKMLLHDHAIARQMGQTSAAVRAAELLGKQLGMFVDRQQVDITILDKLELHEQRALAAALEDLEREPEGTALGSTATH